MTIKGDSTECMKPQRFLTWLACIALTGGLLYATKAVLVPISLAVLLTFMLAPAVIRLQRLGLPKVFAVLSVALLAFALIASISWLVARQLFSLAAELPEHRPVVMAKVESLKETFGSDDGIFDKMSALFEEAQQSLEEEKDKPESAIESAEIKEPEPVAVRVTAEEASFAENFNSFIAPLIEPLATAGLVIVLVLFMLLTREDLRNRIVSLLGQTNLAVTTKALDEAGKRIARYLLMQAVLNMGYGVAVATGLFFLGVPFAPLWGVAAAVLRYIPYVGPWVAAILPLSYSVLTSTDWGQPLGVLGLIVVLELLFNNVFEPLLYGHGVGVSAVGVILAAVFWGWLWGPVGLVLATPLTVCLVVAGRYVPALGFLNRLLGDTPEVEPHIIYYQRLLAKDDDEAEELFDEHVKSNGLASACEKVLVPALVLAKRDRMRRLIEPEQLAFVLESAEEHLEEVPESSSIAEDADAELATGQNEPPTALEPALIFGYSLRDQADEAVLAVLSRLLEHSPCQFVPISSSTLISEVIERIRTEKPLGICLLGLPPGGLTHARTLVKRLKVAVPDVKIAVGRWGTTLPEKYRTALSEAGATYIGRTPEETQTHALSIARLRPADTPTPRTATSSEQGTTDTVHSATPAIAT